jgi:predicted HAD superfamily Cof-like phosphohydrolase
MNLKELLESVSDFQKATGQPTSDKPTLSKINHANLRFDLMKEENEEYIDACRDSDLIEILDACVDQLYVLAGTINFHGLQNVVGEAFNLVHLNNMTKVGPDGKVKRNEFGKILKPEGFQAVDLTKLIK